MPSYIWLIVMAVMIVVEIAVPGLVSIWFAAGALVAYLAALLGAGTAVQVMIFVLVSVVLLLLTRPLAKKYINERADKTNKDTIPGRTAIGSEEVNNLAATGHVTIDGLPWTARAAVQDEIIPVGEEIVVEKIEGVKCIVKRK